MSDDPDDLPSYSPGPDLRDFFDRPITVDEMAGAVERAHREYLAQNSVVDLHAVFLQEASKALRRASVVDEAARRARAGVEAARRALDEAFRDKPEGRVL